MVSDAKKAKEILDAAEETLRSVDHSHVFMTNESREFPLFESSEIVFGALLGKGGFSSVHEVDQVVLLETLPEGAIDQPDKSLPKSNTEHFNHYDVVTARDFMSKHCIRNGSARYAIKKLKEDLGEVDRARGAVDLAIEIKFLTTIWHPNISESIILAVFHGEKSWNCMLNF